MVLKPPLKKSDKIEWIPQAIIRKPVSYFQKRLGLKFVEDSDNLDYFEGTLPARIGNRSFVLRHYRGFPSDVVGIYLPHDLTDESRTNLRSPKWLKK
jgi:hypothetical protein